MDANIVAAMTRTCFASMSISGCYVRGRKNLDGRRSCALAYHGFEIRAGAVLRAISVVDAVVDRPAYLFENDVLRHARGCDPPCLLDEGRLIPARFLSVLGAHVQR